jgi:NADH-quinone oxidoreductase subunit A
VNAWLSTAAFLLVSIAVVAGPLVAAWALRVRAKDNPPTKLLPYECGETPEGIAWVRFHPRYYVVALVFVLFDIEVVFLIPWALNIEKLGLFAILEMFVFLAVLLLGWFYALRKDALRWQ